MQYRCKIIRVPGVLNLRDIGGYPAEGGTAVKTGVFYRAGEMASLTAESAGQIKALGVTDVVDLRSGAETQRAPDTLAADDGVRYHHISMLDYIQSSLAGGDMTNFPASMAEMYRGLLDHGGDQFRQVLTALADAEGAALFHCTAGKDRTGVTAMLLLGLAGVSAADIVEDYSYSEALLEPFESEHTDLPHYLFESRPQTMEAAIAHLEQQYGGVHGYLDHIGFVGDIRHRLLEKLIG